MDSVGPKIAGIVGAFLLLGYVVVQIAPDPRQATPYFTAITLVAILAVVLGFASVLLVAMYWLIRRMLRSAAGTPGASPRAPVSAGEAAAPPETGPRRAERL